jgi:hypothetical protein
LLEFLQFIRGEVHLEQLRSNIDSHDLTARIMSAVYLAHAKRLQGKRGWVRATI